MSKSIDERVVQMEFENSSFEKNAAQSMDTLDKLDEKLKFKNSKKGFEEVEKAAEKTNFATLIKAADVVSEKLKAMEIVGITALSNITNRAIDAGEQLVRSLSIDQITAGYSKYEQKTANVQTILNSTGKSMEEVDKYLERLMWYSDETSYSFNEMLNSYATMLASGGDSENLLSVITGIGNAVSYAGKGAQELNSVLRYSINQAYSKGFLMTQDYQTLQTMNVDNKALRESFIRAGKELQVLDEYGRIISDKNKELVTAENLTSTLAKKWLTKDVMEKAFGYWAEYSDAVYNATKVTKEFAYTSDAMEALKDQYSQISVAGFEAGQQAKTFQETVSAIQDAVSTGWMTTFELLFGKIHEATELWGELYEYLWPIFVEGGENRNNFLSQLMKGTAALKVINGKQDAISGRERLWESVFNILNGIFDRTQAVKEAWKNIFEGPTISKARTKLNQFFAVSEKFKMTEEQGEKITEVFERIFKPLKSVTDFLGKTAKAVFMLGKKTVEFFKYFAKTKEVKTFLDNITKDSKVAKFFRKLTNEVIKFINALNRIDESDFAKVSAKILAGLSTLKEGFENVFSKVSIKKYFTDAWNFIDEKIFTPVKAFLKKLRDSENPMQTLIEAIQTKLKDAGDGISHFLGYADFEAWKESAVNAFQMVGQAIDNFVQKAKDGISAIDLSGILATGLAFVSGYSLIKFVKVSDKIGDLSASIKGVFDKINSNLVAANTLNRVSLNLRIITNSMLKLAIAIAALGLIAEKYNKKMWSAVGMLSAMGILITGLTIALSVFSTKLKGFDLKQFEAMTSVLKKLSWALLIMSAALAVVTKNGVPTFGQALTVLTEFAGMAGILFGLTAGLSLLSGKIAVSIFSVIGIAAAMLLLSKALAKLGEMQINVSNSGKVIIAVASVIAMIVSIVAVFMKAKETVSKGLVGMLAITGSIYLIVQTFKTLSEMDANAINTKNIAVVIATLAGVLLTIPFLSYAAGGFEANWKNMISLAIALPAVIGSMFLIARLIETIDQMKLNQVTQSSLIVLGIGVLIGGLIAAMGFAEKLGGGNNHYLKIAAAIGTIVTAIGSLILLVKLIDMLKISSDGDAMATLTKLFVGIGGLILAVGAMGYLGKGKGVGNLLGLTAVIAVIGAVLIAMSSIKDMEAFKTVVDKFIGILVILGAFIFAISVVIGEATKKKLPKAKSKGKSSPWAGLLETIVVIGGIIAAIVLLRNYLKSPQELLSVGIVIGALLISIFAIIGVLAILNRMKLDNGIFVKIKSLGLLMGAIGLTVLMMAGAMKLMETLPEDGFGKRIFIMLGAIAAMLTVMTVLAGLASYFDVAAGIIAALSVGLVAIGGAMILFAVGVKKLEGVDLAAIGDGLVVLAKGIAASGGAGILMIPGSIGVIAFAGAVALFGLAARTSYKPIANLLIVLNAFANFLSAIGKAFSTEGSFWEKVAAIGPALKETSGQNAEFAESMGALIPEEISEAIEEGIPEIAEAVETIPEVIEEPLEEVKMEVAEKAEDTVEEAAVTVEEAIEKEEKGGIGKRIKEKVGGWFSDIVPVGNIKEQITGGFGELKTALGEFDLNNLGSSLGLENLFSVGGESIGNIGSLFSGDFMSGLTGFDVSGGVQNFMGNLTGADGGLTSPANLSAMSGTGESLAGSMLNGFGTVDYEPSGKNVVDGIISGIDKNKRFLYDKMEEISINSKAHYDGPIKIKSPSREMAKSGMYVVLGLIQGINNTAGQLYGAMGTMAETSVEFLIERMNAVENGEALRVSPVLDMDDLYSKWETLFQDGYVFHPVIQPVMDMSGVDMTVGNAEAVMYGRMANTGNGYGDAAINDRLAAMMTQMNRPAPNIVLNVYGSEGQDIEELADIVMSRMENAYAVKAQVFA